MMVLTGSILMMSVYLASMQVVFQSAQQNEAALVEFLQHQQAVIAWGSTCRLAKRTSTVAADEPSMCKDAPTSGTSAAWQAIDWNATAPFFIANANLRSRGVTGLSDNWKTIWYVGNTTSGGAGLYFYPTSGANFTADTLKALQTATGSSIMHGTIVQKEAKWLINANQPEYAQGATLALSLDNNIISLDAAKLTTGTIISTAVLPRIF